MYAGPVRGDIKTGTVDDLDRLQRASVGASGRPQWIVERRGEIQKIRFAVLAIEQPGIYRCVAIAFTSGETAWAFTVDITFSDFDALPDVSKAEVVEMAHSYLASFPMLPLDRGPRASWDDPYPGDSHS
jgi:hypothetical protein